MTLLFVPVGKCERAWVILRCGGVYIGHLNQGIKLSQAFVDKTACKCCGAASLWGTPLEHCHESPEIIGLKRPIHLPDD
ncbi:hypothetical protein [Sulfitobacter sp.]|jgi:hypothetical protein|uniref:hypothetical protein n=1 Tax=Sulfitobacter sp. TaxID=1903071 RepID=UPI00356639A1